MKTWLAAALLALLSAGCGWVSFSRRMSDEEVEVRQELVAYYAKVQEAFAAGSPDYLTSLFAASITKPMTLPQIADWAKTFFAAHANAVFHVKKLDFDSVGLGSAEVTLSYWVETPDHEGEFGGVERDQLIKIHGQWRISSWEVVDPSKEPAFDTLWNHR